MSADFKAFIHFEITGEKKARALQDALAEVGVSFEYAKDSAGKLSAALDGLSTKKLKDVEETIGRVRGEWGKKFGPMHSEGFKVLSSGVKPKVYTNQIIKDREDEAAAYQKYIKRIQAEEEEFLRNKQASINAEIDADIKAAKAFDQYVNDYWEDLRRWNRYLAEESERHANIRDREINQDIRAYNSYRDHVQDIIDEMNNLERNYTRYVERELEKRTEIRERELTEDIRNFQAYENRMAREYENSISERIRLEEAFERQMNAIQRERERAEREYTRYLDWEHNERIRIAREEANEQIRIARQEATQQIAAEEAYARHLREIERERTRQQENELSERIRMEAAFERQMNAIERERERAAAQRLREEREETRRLQGILNDRNRRIRAFYTATQRMRSMMHGGGIGGGGGGMLGGFPIVRLFIFDSIRRMITGLHQAVASVGQTIAGWVVDGIKFNDEMKRAQTYFTSLGLIGQKGALGGQMTIAEARASKDPEITNAFKKSEQISQRMITKMMEISAQTGQDLQEIVTAARQSASDLLNKMNKPGQPNAFLQRPEVIEDITTRLVKLSSVLRMADPQNRKLSFHLVGLQEFFSGTSGGPKSQGASLALSLMRREGLRVGKQYTSEIAKAVNSGDLKKAMDIIEEVLTNAGVGIDQIANFMDETLNPSIDSTIMMLRRFNMEITSNITNDSLRAFFAGLKNYLLYISNQEGVMKMLSRVSIVLNNAFWGLSRRITETIDSLMQNPDLIETTMLNMIKTIESSVDLALSVFEAAGAFMAGLFNGDMSQSIDNISTRIQENLPFFYALGYNFTQLASAVINNIVVIVRFILMINAVIIAINIIVGVLSLVASVISLVALGFLPLTGGAMLAVAAIATLAAALVGIAGWIGWNAPDWMSNLATNPFQELAANIPQIDQAQISKDIAEAVEAGVATGSSQAVEESKKVSKETADKKFGKFGRTNPFEVTDAIKKLQNRVPGAMPIPDPKNGMIDPSDRASILAKANNATQYATPLIPNNRSPNQVEIKKRTEIKDQRQIIQISGPITIKTDDPKGFMDKLSELGRKSAGKPSGEVDPDFASVRASSDLNFGVL